MKVNQLKAGVVLSYLTTGVNMLVQVLYTPVMIRILGQSEYGLYTLVGSVVSYLSLFSLGFTGAYLRFSARYESRNDKTGLARLNGMFLSLFMLMGILAFICGMVLANFPKQLFGTNLTTEELGKAQILMYFLVLNIAFTFPNSIFDSIVSSREQFVFQRLLTLAGVLFNPFVCLPFLLLGYGSIAVVAVTTIITFLKLIINIWFCTRKLHVRFEFSHFDFSLLKEISGFSFFIFINMIIDQLNWSVDKYILGRVAGTVVVAIYGVGSQINSIVMSLGTMIPTVFSPRVNQIVASNRVSCTQELNDLLIKVGRMSFLITLYIYIGFVFCGREFVCVWAGSEYEEAYIVVLLLITPLLLILPRHLGIEMRRAKNMHKVPIIILLILTIMNVIISIPLSIKYGATGAAFGTFLTLMANTILSDIYYIKVVKINMILLYKNLLKIFRGTIRPIIFGLFGCMWDSLWKCILWAVAYTLLYAIFVYRFSMNDEEKKLVTDVIDKVIKRKK